MKKIFITALCAVLLITSMASCSKKEEKKPQKETQAETEVIEETTTTSEPEPSPVDPTPFYGCWKYTNRDEWIAIYENGIYEVYGVMEDVIINKPFTATENGILLPEQEGITLYFDEDGILRSDIGDEFEEGESIFYTMYMNNHFSTITE